jgi:hypothetical protein
MNALLQHPETEAPREPGDKLVDAPTPKTHQVALYRSRRFSNKAKSSTRRYQS